MASGEKKEGAFFERVKGRLRSRDQYQEFLKLLYMYLQGVISRQELQSMVSAQCPHGSHISKVVAVTISKRIAPCQSRLGLPALPLTTE